ncbi:MAG TPA: hypothetical protein PLZ45_15260, partial [Ferruginibacter sp.]|nr:hypothetical protein [Ferruginibacter sp.]
MPLNQISFAFDEMPVKEEPAVKKIIAEEPAPPKTRTRADNKKLTRGRVSLKEMDAGVDLIEIPEDDVLFQKSY